MLFLKAHSKIHFQLKNEEKLTFRDRSVNDRQQQHQPTYHTAKI